MSRRQPIPILGLLALATLPAVALGAAWSWAEDEAAAIPPPTTFPAPVGEPTGTLYTPLGSLRRHPAPLAADRAAGDYREIIDPFLEFVPEGSCVSVTVDGNVVAAKNDDMPVIPASNMKLLVAAVALDVLGADSTFTTAVYGPPPVDGVVNGDLILVGGGDPVLATADEPDPSTYPAINTTDFGRLAQQLIDAGITSVTGSIVADGTRYDDEFFAPTWTPEVRGFSAGPYDALMVNDGRNRGTKGLNPAQYAAQTLNTLLQTGGALVIDGNRQGELPAEGVVELASVESLPLTSIVEELLLTSDNNTAEMLVKELGHVAGAGGTRDAGLLVIWETLATWGVPLEGVNLADGSGLSRENRLTCTALADLLSAIADDDDPDNDLIDLLPVAGESGTLENEFVDTASAGRLYAKTGTLTGVRALSGYTDDKAGSQAVFSIVLNDEDASDPAVYWPIWAGLTAIIAEHPIAPDDSPFEPRATASGS